MKRILAILTVLFLLPLLAVECLAVDPFDNNVVGVTQPHELYFTLYPVFYTASKIKDSSGNIITNDLKARLYENVFRLTYYNKAALGNTIILSGTIPVGEKVIQGSSDIGLGDATLVAGYWFIDDKASGTWLAAGSYFDFPTGDYNANRTANMGSNVYKIRPSVVFAKQIDRFDIELTSKYNMYTKNPDTGLRQGNEFIGEAYAGYFLRPNLIAGVHLNATMGQDSYLYSTRVADSAVQSYQAGPSVMWISGKFSMLLVGLGEFAARNTSEGYMIYARLSWKIL